MDALREGNESFLVCARARVDVHDGLIGLRGEDVRAACGEAVGERGALLEGAVDCVGGVQGVGVDADVFGDGGVGGFLLRADGGDEFFGERHLGWRTGGCEGRWAVLGGEKVVWKRLRSSPQLGFGEGSQLG